MLASPDFIFSVAYVWHILKDFFLTANVVLTSEITFNSGGWVLNKNHHSSVLPGLLFYSHSPSTLYSLEIHVVVKGK